MLLIRLITLLGVVAKIRAFNIGEEISQDVVQSFVNEKSVQEAIMNLDMNDAKESPTIRKEGYCSMYSNCGKRSYFGSPLPCSSNVKAKVPNNKEISLLNSICGADFDSSLVCCSEDQLTSMESSLKRLDPLLSSCPACHHNFYDFICRFTCSPNQSTFVKVLDTLTSVDTHEQLVTQLNQYVDPDYAEKFFDSCKNVKFSATNGYAMDLIGGGATNYKDFLKFIGDEKPFLGGSPFQMNFRFDTTEAEEDEGLIVRTSEMKACDDEEYKCACSDCAESCPILPTTGFPRQCTVGSLSCFTFSVFIVWIWLGVVFVGYRVYKRKFKEETPVFLRIHHPSHINDWQLKVTGKIEDAFRNIGWYCASNPFKTIGTGIAVSLLLSLGLLSIQLETDPTNLWVPPTDPASLNQNYFESHFGEWFRIEQIIVSSDEPILNWSNIEWWFEKELQFQELGGTQLNDICFKPLGETCGIQSFTQYFDGDISRLTEDNWKQQLKSCGDSPVNCLPSFQMPLKTNILFDTEDILKAKAFIVTILVDSELQNFNKTSAAVNYEKALQNLLEEIKSENPNVEINYSTEGSLTEELNRSTTTDIKVIALSYLLMFIYSSLALGKFPTSKEGLVFTRFLLGLGGIVIIILSVTSAAGFCALLGLKSTLIIAEVIPFLVLAIGVDNIFLIVNALPDEGFSVESRISGAMASIGPSCLILAILQLSMFLLASRVDMPAVRNFALYSAGAIFVNFVLQMTVFVGLLALDEKRIEQGRLDIFPWIQVAVEEEVEEQNGWLTDWFENVYAPKLLSKEVRIWVLTVFTVMFGISLAYLPNVTLGLDQRTALPRDSYLTNYFDAVYDYLDVGPPLFLVIKDLDLTVRDNQKKVCGKFGGCDEFSVANILEQEYKRGDKSTLTTPASSWLDDYLLWLNPTLDCCRVKKLAPDEFCSPFAPERQCEMCYAGKEYETTLEGLPVGEDFMYYFNEWIESPSDPCPLGGKAPYSTSVYHANGTISASYLRAGHKPLRSQKDFIDAYSNSLRIVEEIKTFQPLLDIFAYSPIYVFFVQYQHIVRLTFQLLATALVIIWIVSGVLLGSIRCSAVLVATITLILVNIGGVLAIWSISLNAVSLVNLIICCGLAVEFTIHLTREYSMAIEEEYDVDFLNDAEQSVKVRKSLDALSAVGALVFSGITMTKLIGVLVLAFAQSQIFEIYYFRMWLLLVFIAAAHSLILLPVLLSYFGDGEQAKPVAISEERRYGRDD